MKGLWFDRLGFATVVTVLAIAGPGCRGNDAPTRKASPSLVNGRGRADMLVRAAASSDWSVRERAIRELGWIADADSYARSELAGLLISPHRLDDGQERIVVQCIGALSVQAKEEVVRRICGAKLNENSVDRVLRVIGRSRCNLEPERSFLLGVQRAYPERSATQGRVMTLLALREPRGTLARQIIKEVETSSARAEGVLAMLADMGSCTADVPGMRTTLEGLLRNDRGEASVYAAAAFVQSNDSIDDAARTAMQDLARRHRHSTDDAFYVVYATALARISPDAMDGHMGTIASDIGNGEYGGHTGAAAADVAAMLFTDEMLEACLRMAGGEDSKRARGAIMLASYMGRRPEVVAARLIELAERSRVESVREEAATSLRWCAPMSSIPLLRDAMGSESSQGIREALRQTISIIELNSAAGRRQQ